MFGTQKYICRLGLGGRRRSRAVRRCLRRTPLELPIFPTYSAKSSRVLSRDLSSSAASASLDVPIYVSS